MRLLEWMAAQDFEKMRDTLLPLVEEVVVEEYAAVFDDPSRPNAYRWIRYEDPDPIGRLHWAARRLGEESKRRAPENARQLEQALAVARGLGYPG